MKRKKTYRIHLFTTFILIGCCGLSARAEAEKKEVPARVLFIGNSYTARIKRVLNPMLANSPYKDTVFEFITKGGATLQEHLADTNVLDRIKTGNWDIVVLQEQSQTPALPGEPAQSFQDSVDIFTGLIKKAGAEPVLYMTWGRRDGDKQNPKIFPDYNTMQKKLTVAYQTAAKRNRLTVAPVGKAWSVVWKKDSELAAALYNEDGSHPSIKGGFLISCVFFRTLFNDPLESVWTPSEIEPREQKQIIDAVRSLDML